MHRLSFLTTAALLTVLLASPAAANDSLLSGYGGPGNGEQAVLGSQLVGGGSSGGGKSGGGSGASASLRAPSAASTSATTGRPAALSTTPGTSSAASAGKTGSARKTTKHRSARGSSGAQPTLPGVAPQSPTAAKAVPSGLPPRVAYPDRASAGGGSPLTRADLLILVLAIGALLALALGLRRVTESTGAADLSSARRVSRHLG